MVSLIILLLGLFTAGVVVGVFIMALLELKQIDVITGKAAATRVTETSVVPIAADDALPVKQS